MVLSSNLSQPVSTQKTEFRAKFKDWRPSAVASLALHHVLEFFLAKKSGIWGSFVALSNEVSLAEIHQKSKNIKWAFPRIVGEEMHYYVPGAKDFMPGTLGVQEPVVEGAQKIEISDLTGVLIPGLAFDLGGTRLGRGKGYYDRNFKDFKKQTVGIALRDQVFQKLPREDFDLQVKHLVTDGGILHF